MLKRVEKILTHYVDDYCLGRQFAQILSGHSNDQRGKILRKAMAMAIDAGEEFNVDPSNFYGFKFRSNKEFEKKITKPEKCFVCNGFFEDIDKTAERIAKKLEGYDFKTFLVGSRPSQQLLEKEEKIWESAGIDFCEPIKAEINRELGKRIEKILRKKADIKKPDISVLLDLEENRISIVPNPLFISGFYKKYKRGIPQSKWGTPGKYKTSVEELIAIPIMKETKAVNHKFHGSGREDIDARCLDWRGFVVEMVQPMKRNIDLKRMMKKINKGKKVEVSKLKTDYMERVRKLKSAKNDKTYRALVVLDKPIEKKKLNILTKLKGNIEQKTPERVVHRRADLMRTRKVKSVKTKFINNKKFDLIVKGTAGLYIKELISGDSGRTKPSVSDLLNRKANCKELDIIKIEKL